MNPRDFRGLGDVSGHFRQLMQMLLKDIGVQGFTVRRYSILHAVPLSSLLTCIALLRRQINTSVWESGHPVLCKNPKFAGWELDNQPGPVKVGFI